MYIDYIIIIINKDTKYFKGCVVVFYMKMR